MFPPLPKVRGLHTDFLMNILVCEDDSITRLLYSIWLEGHKFVICENGTESLESSRKGKFDFLILDVGLPDGNGLDFGLQILDMQPQLSILIASAHNTHDEAKIQKIKEHENLLFFESNTKGEFLPKKIENMKIKIFEHLRGETYKKTCQ